MKARPWDFSLDPLGESFLLEQSLLLFIEGYSLGPSAGRFSPVLFKTEGKSFI